MNRSELKPGRVVECRNGYRYFILINGNGELLGVRGRRVHWFTRL